MVRHPHYDRFLEAARPTDKGVQVLPLKWVFNYKLDIDGLLVKYKARICVRGDLQKITTEEKYSATLAVRTARFVFALMAYVDLDSSQFYAVNTFLNSLLDEAIYVEQTPGMFRDPKRQRCCVRPSKIS